MIANRKILLTNSLGNVSRGCYAVQAGCINSIKAAIPGAQISVWSTRADADKINYNKFDVQIIPHPWLKRYPSMGKTLFLGVLALLRDFWRHFVLSKELSSIADCDVMVSLNMDGFNDKNYGVFFTLQGLALTILPGLFTRKGYAIVPASIGPLRSRVIKALVKRALNRMGVVATRGQTSMEYCKAIGIPHNKIHLSADLGFLLQECPESLAKVILSREGVSDTGKLIVGISPSNEMAAWAFPEITTLEGKRDAYHKLMARAIDYVIANYQVQVLFIPNVLEDELTGLTSDGAAANIILSNLENRNSVKILPSHYSTEEIKGVIGNCAMFVSCRMHSAIFSTSMNIPTVTMTYGKKFDDVIGGTMGQWRYMVSMESPPDMIWQNLKSAIDEAWMNRQIIKADLIERNTQAKEKALLFGQLVKQLAPS